MTDETGSRFVASVAERILRDVVAGGSAPSSRLPSERELATRLEVSRGTVRMALHALADQGHVISLPQSGWYVSDAYPAPRGPLMSFTEIAARDGSQPTSHILDAHVRLVSELEVEALQLGPEERVLDVTRVRRRASQLACLERNVVALRRAPGIEDEDLEDASLYDAFRRHGVEPSRSDLTVEAALAGTDAVFLDIASTMPTLIEHERCFDQYGAVVMLGRTTWPADRYRFRATLVAR